MRRAAFLLALAIVLGGARPAACQSVHALIVGDVSPAAHWGQFERHINMDVAMVASIMSSHVPESRLVLRVMTIENNEDAAPRAILAALDELAPGPEDTLIVYYTGHGAADDRGQYFDLAAGPLYRADLRNAMAAKGARLDVLLTDCCNARSDGKSQARPYIDTPPPEDFSTIFRSLFIDQRGSVDINGCAPGESAFFAPKSNEGPSTGSLFTLAIEEYLRVNRDREVPWDDLLLGVSLTVHMQFRNGYPQGVKFAKGAAVQRDQNVFAAEYPGMPEERGPRADMLVRDASGQGAYVIEVGAGSPGTRAWDVTGNQYVTFGPGNLIVAANGVAVRSAADFKTAVADSPQVMRITLNAEGNLRDYLIRLRY